MPIKLATWNVNSLRVRLPQVLNWLKEASPDIVAFQETKLINTDFPLAAFEEMGYRAVFSGQKTYNGVAILSREHLPTNIITDIPSLNDPQRRLLAVSIGALRIVNVYVPNGESITSDKYQYKLNWLSSFHQFLETEFTQHNHLVVLGDFNIAPQEIDVHDPIAWHGQVLCSQLERKSFQALLNLGFADCFRLNSPEEKSFSWWDYRLNAFKRNMGLRIDHILASANLMNYCKHCYIDKLPRSWERPSDHAPVIAEFLLD